MAPAVVRAKCKNCGVEGDIYGPTAAKPDHRLIFRCRKCSVEVWKILIWMTYWTVGTPCLIGVLLGFLIGMALGHEFSHSSLILGGLGFYAVLLGTPVFWAWKLNLFRV